MRCLLVGLMMSVLACGLAYAQDKPAAGDNEPAAQQQAVAGRSDVTGIPLYQGPEYSSIESNQADINKPPEFHSFHQLPTEVAGYSPLTLADFRFPVVKRIQGEFNLERMYYPKHSVMVWHDRCHGFTVSAFFFTRDMVRDHIQRLIDEYYICEPDLLQQVIDYYAEVTPQCGEVISWVWFAVDNDSKTHNYADRRDNPYFRQYLYNFKDKFYLEFGLPKVQDKLDREVRDFLYQYQKRGKYVCGPQFKERVCGCDKCANKAAAKCDTCTECTPSAPKDCYPCNECPEKHCKAGDKALYCTDYKYHGFNMNVNSHYLYYPRKVVIEDLTYDPVAQAYRWKFAWRFNDCEVDWLKQMCQYGESTQWALVLSDPTWYSYAVIDGSLKRDLLASMDPNTWGNVWPAGQLPYDMTCCPCPLPNCPGNCQAMEPVGWPMAEEAPEVVPEVEVLPAPESPSNDYTYFPPPEKKPEVIKVQGKG